MRRKAPLVHSHTVVEVVVRRSVEQEMEIEVKPNWNEMHWISLVEKYLAEMLFLPIAYQSRESERERNGSKIRMSSRRQRISHLHLTSIKCKYSLIVLYDIFESNQKISR
jgi:hypothetical protein